MDTDPDAALQALTDHLNRYADPGHLVALEAHLAGHVPLKLLLKVHQLMHQHELDAAKAAVSGPPPLPRRVGAGRHRPRIPTRHGN